MDLIRILKIIEIISPHISKTLQIISHPDGSADIQFRLNAADVGFDDTLTAIKAWREEHQTK